MNMVVFGAVPEWISNWLTPIWLLGVGCLLGLFALAVLWGLLWLISRPLPLRSVLRRAIDEVPLGLREGVLLPLLWLTGTLACFGVLGVFFVHTPRELLASVPRLLGEGYETMEFEVPPTPRDEQGDVDSFQETKVKLDVASNDIRQLIFQSDQDLTVALIPATSDVVSRPELRVPAQQAYSWVRGTVSNFQVQRERLEHFYVINHGDEPASIKLTVLTSVSSREVIAIPYTAAAVIGVFLIYLLQRAFAPRLSAVALSTYKSELAQPFYWILISVGIFGLAVFVFLPYNTFGEDIKMLKDSGFSLIMVLCLIMSVWSASTSVSEEIEGRTALTVLSKPIRRASFVLGKYLGISWTVALMFILLGVVFLIAVAYKPLYDAREVSKSEPTWQLCYYEMIVTIPGLVLSFMQTLVLAAVSVAISTRLPLLANFVICFSIFVLGNITPLLVQSSQEQFEIVRFFAQLIATVLPNLEVFNMQAAIAADAEVPIAYLGTALLYCVIYSVIAMLLALLLFEDRDLA